MILEIKTVTKKRIEKRKSGECKSKINKYANYIKICRQAALTTSARQKADV